jgi:ferredoxin
MSYRIDIGGQFFHCLADVTVLLAMTGKGLKHLPIGCCAGGCGVCKVKVVQGQYITKVMSRAHVSTEEQAQGFALACRILPLSDLKLEQVKKE